MSKVETDVTEEQFQAFVTVQESGMYNMFDPMARMATGLEMATFIRIMENYAELSNRYLDEEAREEN